MRVLDKKMFRDLWRIWAQALAIALVMACGVATIVLAVGAHRSLEETRSAFYDRYRFGTVFASAVRAPLSLGSRISALSGVSGLELRIVKPVLLDIPFMQEPASGVLISVPDNRQSQVNRLYLRKGRLPEKGRSNEVAVTESFAGAHAYQPGDQFKAIINGRLLTLNIVGIVLSPEYIYAVGPGDMVPDQKRYGVLFMSQEVLAGLFSMEDSFNNAVLTTTRGTDLPETIGQVDRLLEPYGGLGAIERKDQISNAFLDAELDQLQAMSAVIPPIFLFVSAFLVNMILSRLVALEREQIGLLKALGYANGDIAFHYAKLVIVIALVGLLIGSGVGFWMGRALTRLYASFFSFPFLIFRHSIDLYILAGGVTVLAALIGALRSIWSVVALPPAVAMRPPAPTLYKSHLPQSLHLSRFVSQLTTMAFRYMFRRPLRFAMTTFGTSLSVALLVTALFSYDAIDYMIDIIFFQADRQDATVTFASERSWSASFEIAALPGVLKVEPFRTAAVKLRNGHRELQMSISALPEEALLSRILDIDLAPMVPPKRGLVISDRVANKLHLKIGDLVDVELTQKNDRIERLPVTGIAQSYVGLTAFMSLEALNRVMRDGNLVSGVRILNDVKALTPLYTAIKKTPAIASIALQNSSRDNFRSTIEQNITTMMSVYVGLAVIITFGVVYNSARIQLSERARELASLRVFGFTRAEVSRVLFTELVVIVLLAQPLGWLFGYGFSWSMVKGFESDLFRIPLILVPSTFAVASLVVITAAIGSALIVRRRIDRLDLIRVLKTRE
jgi:putative ABC transport system permease protein